MLGLKLRLTEFVCSGAMFVVSQGRFSSNAERIRGGYLGAPAVAGEGFDAESKQHNCAPSCNAITHKDGRLLCPK